MGLTEALKLKRSRHLGASEAASAMGLNQYRSAYDLWLIKTGRVEEVSGGSEAQTIGHMLESPLIDWMKASRGIRSVIRNQFRVSKNHPELSCTHDALVKGDNVGIEAKTAGIMGGWNMPGWGEQGTDQIPTSYWIQCQHQMLVSDLRLVIVPALLVGRGRVWYEVHRDDSIVDKMAEHLTRWYQRHVVQDIQPTDDAPSIKLGRNITRKEGTRTKISEDTVNNWIKGKEDVRRMESGVKDLEKQILVDMADNEIGSCSLGVLTYPERSRVSVDSKKLKSMYPEVYKKVSRVTTFRSPAFKKNKEK